MRTINLTFLQLIMWFLCSFVVLTGCQTKPAETVPEKPHWIFQTGLLTPSSQTSEALFKLQPTESDLGSILDDEIYARGGLVWQPFIMAQNAGAKLFERDFLLGFRQSKKKIEGFQKNTCYVVSGGKKRKVTLKANAKDVTATEGQLFYIFDLNSREFVGIGSFDSAGLSNCDLPFQELIISTGFGEARREAKLNPTATELAVDVALQATAVVKAGEGELHAGDLVRFARIRAKRNEVGKEDAWRQIAQRIDDDLYRMVLSPSENFNASETMLPTFGVTAHELLIPLEAGTYVAASIERVSGRVCVQEFTVNAGENFRVGCTYRQSAQTSLGSSALSSRRVLRSDATVLSPTMVQDTNFRGWMNEHGYDFLFIDSTSTNPDLPKKYFLPMTESTLQKFDLKKSQLEVVNESVHTRFDGQLPSFLTPHLHLMETGVRNMLDGGITPFLLATQWYVDEPYHFDPNTNLQLLTNGTQIDLTDPVISNRSLVEIVSTPRVRGRILVPAYQKVEFLELYVNGTLSKRTVLPRSAQNSIESELEFFFDENLDEKNDFYLTIVAWGENFLPEFIYGQSRLKPFAILSPLCFDVNKNKVCDAKAN